MRRIVNSLCFSAVLFIAVSANAQDKLYPPIKIYIETPGSDIPEGLVMSRIKIDCSNCIQTINRGSASLIVQLERISSDQCFWSIYGPDGTAVFQASSPDSIVGAMRSVSLRLYEYSEILAGVIREDASKAKASKPGTLKTSKKNTQKTI